jgi:hypothetical protein
MAGVTSGKLLLGGPTKFFFGPLCLGGRQKLTRSEKMTKYDGIHITCILEFVGRFDSHFLTIVKKKLASQKKLSKK